jgi:hypothetical protein
MDAILFGTRISEADNTHLSSIRHLFFGVRPVAWRLVSVELIASFTGLIFSGSVTKALLYDFGGWYPGTQNQALLQINRFKESFGGELVVQYKCDWGVTWKGALGLWIARSIRPQKND